MKKILSDSKLVSLLVVIILLLIGINKLDAQVTEADKVILMDLYNATNGANWTNNTNWGTTEDVSTWYGITVLANKVVTIDLNRNNLDGSIPVSLGQLTSLLYLKLDSNKISGSIPVELGNLSNLLQLYLGGNQLSDPIPGELAGLSNLKWLNLSDNQLTGTIPEWLGQMDLLEYLQLSVNNLTGSIPSQLGDLANLKWLNLGENQLEGNIPVTLGQISGLEQLYLDGNQLSGTIPKELGQLLALQWLKLGQNELSGAIPAELKTLTNLELLYLDGNQLDAIPSDLGLLTGLEWLNLSNNQFTGDIPAGIWQLTNLQLLYLNENQFTGGIPGTLGQFIKLKWLDFDSNQLISLPDLTALDSLSKFTVSNNKFTFVDLEYNMNINDTVIFVYVPQDSIGTRESISKNEGEILSYTISTGGTQNQYRWYKDGVLLADQTSETIEITGLTTADAGKYYCEVTNVLVPGLTLTSRKITLSVVDPNETVTINLKTGWNIFSSPVMPADKNLKNILQPLIIAGQLKKVMDETGNVIEDWGSFGGWQNKIGDIKSTEGYKINVTSDATVEISGIPTQLPYDIELKNGWNIISWPSLNEQNGEDVFQTLIDDGKLKKVMDELGNVIEDWGSFGGWRNTIGNLKPGEGYKVNVTGDCVLNIENGLKSSEVLPELIASTHFIPAYKGNGIDHMNINLVNLAESGIMEGDEIGIFEGNICVGSAKVTINNTSGISLIASAKDESSDLDNGFKPGSDIILKLWRSAKEYPLSVLPVNGTSAQFQKNGSIFAKVNLEINTGIDFSENSFNVTCYPNPFETFVNIEVNLTKRTDVIVEIYDLQSRKICQLYNGNAEQLKLRWDGNDLRGNRVTPGIYICRVNDIWKKVALNGN